MQLKPFGGIEHEIRKVVRTEHKYWKLNDLVKEMLSYIGITGDIRNISYEIYTNEMGEVLDVKYEIWEDQT